MTERTPEFSRAMAEECLALRNVRPSAFGIATDWQADQSARWKAFDDLFEEIVEGMRRHGFPLEEVDDPVGGHRLRLLAATTLFQIYYGGDDSRMKEAWIQAEQLVPPPPHPETLKPQLGLADQALLHTTILVAREEFPVEFKRFFLADSTPLEVRKQDFKTLHALIGGGWYSQSLYARSLNPVERQKMTILSLMCCVDGSQWGEQDLREMEAALIPTEEPPQFFDENPHPGQ